MMLMAECSYKTDINVTCSGELGNMLQQHVPELVEINSARYVPIQSKLSYLEIEEFPSIN